MTRPDADTRGQVLIISAAALIVLMAIGAIVVDLGMSWLLHRKEQNAVDPASIAAAQWVAPFGTRAQREAEACFYAQRNGFFLGDANCAAALAPGGGLEVNSPPATTRAGNFQGRPGFVEVIIHDTHPSFFGQLFGRPVAEVVTAAVAANTEGNSNSSSLIALGETCQGNEENGASQISGHGTVLIHPADGVTDPGGYINVNAPCGAVRDPAVCDGNGAGSALGVVGGATLRAPHVFVVGGCGVGGGGSLNCYPSGSDPCLDEQSIPLGDPLGGLPEPWPILQGSLPVPDCPDPAEINSPADQAPCDLDSDGGNATCPVTGCVMDPGVYYAGWTVAADTSVVMRPGLYVFAGGGLSFQNDEGLSITGGVDGLGNPIDARVTIFSTEHAPGCQAGIPTFCQGEIKINTRGPLRLAATNLTTCQQVSPQICAWAGILLWQDGTLVSDPKDISITAQADMILSGTIYAPESLVDITGQGTGSGCSGSPQRCLAVQIIARQWKVSGGGLIDMPYNPDELYQLEQQGLVH